MITAKSSFDGNMKMGRPPQNRRFWNGAYFRHVLKTGWPTVVVMTVVIVLVVVMPFCSYITEQRGLTQAGFREGTLREMNYTSFSAVLLSMAMGLVCGMSSLRFLNHKVAVNFYHSLPVRREALFTVSAAHGILSYTIAQLIGMGICFGVAVANFGHADLFFTPAAYAVIYGLIFFLLIYSVTLFAATLTGTGFMRLVIAGEILFLPVVAVLMMVVTAHIGSIHGSIIDIDYYGELSTLVPLCLPLRMAGMIEFDYLNFACFKSPLNTDVLVVVGSTLFFFAAALFSYTRRHSEESTKPVVKKWAELAVKYVSIFIGSTFFGLIFIATTGSRVWMCVGILFGAVILQMITSGVLNKSARAIFKGLRGFAACLGVIAIVTCVFYLDLFGFTSSIPSPAMVNSVEVSLAGYEVVEFDGEFADKVTRILRDMYVKSDLENGDIWADGEIYYVPFEDVRGKKYGGIDNTFISTEKEYDSVAVNAVFRTKVGVPLSVRFYVNCETVEPLATLLYPETSTRPEGTYVENVYMETPLGGCYGPSIMVTKGNYTELAALLSDPTGEKGTSPVVGYIAVLHINDDRYIPTTSYNYEYLQICAADTEAIEWLFPNAEDLTEEQVIRDIIEMRGYDGVCVVDCNTDETEYYTDIDDMFRIAAKLDSFVYNYGYRGTCRKNHDYNVYFINIEPTMANSERFWFNENVTH